MFLCMILKGVITVIIFWISYYFYKIYNHLHYFPTTPFIPIIGHIFDYANPSKTLNTLTKKLVRHGGILRQFFGPRKPSLVTANRYFLKFLCDKSKYLGKSKYYKLLKPWLGEGLITSDGQKWLSRRKALAFSFTQTSVLKSFIEVFDKKSEILLSILERFNKENVDIHPIMKKFTIDVITETTMGISLNSLEDHHCSKISVYAKNIEILCEIIQKRMMSFFKNFDFFFQFSADCKRQSSALAVIDKMLENIINQKLQQKNLKRNALIEKKDMLDLLMEVEIDGKLLDFNDLREEINTMMFAGYDTTSTAMSLVLYQIAEHSEIQEKIVKEQNYIEKKINNEPITLEILNEMKYLEQVIQETMRFYTIVPFVGKKVLKDLNYDDEKILPSMLNISIFIHGFHHNPNYFPDPQIFNPERFSDRNNIDKYTYMPFGVKPRQCLGKNFAILEMKCVLSKIIRKYKIKKVNEKSPLKMVPKLVLFSANGIWVRFKKRYK